MSGQQDDLAKQLEDARRLIEHHASEIERLKALDAGGGFSDQLRDLMVTTAATGVIASSTPQMDALYHIVETATEVLDAAAAALFLVDEEAGDLVFQVALGGRAEEVKQFRLELGHGFAGWVAATGQPIAVAEAEQDERFAREIALAVDYMPKTVLCVPLVLEYRVIGVLELLDKAGGVPFSARDMETLGRFANLAARTIDESRLTHDMRHLFRSLLKDLSQGSKLEPQAERFADQAAEYGENADAIRLAGLIHDLCSRGESARRLALEVLTSLNRYFATTSAM